ncbi:overexpressed in colon carcinoma 1 protein isoform X2 [Myotis lucifugus]|uniref:overexpressed in colon carcinoma 1 protein isoform X2 n=1 Tax=Myotis lucifugus TaxID=59463 RepID=UPI000CCC7F9B|nr:overexpressed in colon carcinoma 1 protein isoform X2 [Myotis lucifugus]
MWSFFYKGPAGAAKDVTEDSLTEDDKRRSIEIGLIFLYLLLEETMEECMLVSHLKLSTWYLIQQRQFKKIRRKYDNNQEHVHQDLETLQCADISKEILNSHLPPQPPQSS